MNKFIKQIIEEKFESKRQSRLFFAKANDKSLPKSERKKWKKWAEEFADKTDYKHTPETKGEFDEVVDEDGNILTGSKSTDFNSKNTTTKKTTDQYVKSVGGQQGGPGLYGGVNSYRLMRYFGENDMSKALGYDETMGSDEDMKDAKEYFQDDLDIPSDETKDRLHQMGYDENLPKGKVRLIENPKRYVEEYIESLMSNKSKENDILEKNKNDDTNVSPIVKKQISALKQTLKSNNVSYETLIKMLKSDE